MSDKTTEPIGPRDEESLSERLTKITAQRNKYWEQVEVLVEALRELGVYTAGLELMFGLPEGDALSKAQTTLAAVAEESGVGATKEDESNG